MAKQHFKSIYAQAEQYADLTKAMIRQGKIQRTKKCFSIAEQLLKTGTLEVKNAITNVYLFSLSTFMEIHNCNIKGLLPDGLRKEYFKQVNASGL